MAFGCFPKFGHPPPTDCKEFTEKVFGFAERRIACLGKLGKYRIGAAFNGFLEPADMTRWNGRAVPVSALTVTL